LLRRLSLNIVAQNRHHFRGSTLMPKLLYPPPLFGLAALLFTLAGCGKPRSTSAPKKPEVAVYTALDEEFSKPVLKIHESKSGTTVLPVFDTESTKSFGLAGRIISEAAAPTCDLFWNNEILNTLRLKQKGLLEPFFPKAADAIPSSFKDPDGQWYGFAARARILLVNTEIVPENERPRGIRDLLDPKWKRRIGIAKPLFGTTGTHAACLFAAWGEDAAKKFFQDLKANDALILSGNRQVASSVGTGRIAFGLTDTDDALAEIAAGSPVAIIYPDRQSGELGTLFIPNTLALIKGSPHEAEAEALAEYLLSPAVEGALAQGPSGQIPLNPAVDVPLQVESPRTVPPMKVDFEAAARLWEPVVAPFLTELFATAE
jgi:iron(III) transport system substrate-binding protein